MAGIWGFTPSDQAASGISAWWNTPIKNRYNILPLAEDARTGQNVLAVPGLIAEPFESLKRVIASGGRTDTTYDDAGVPVSGRGTLSDLDGLNVAGIAPLGTMALGTAAGAIERGAMGAGPVRAANPKGFTAYHGSPHDFDKFDLSKIGTGEGAQAYGHGLYFAQNEGVARSYREGLSAKHAARVSSDAEAFGKTALEITDGDKGRALSYATKRAEAGGHNADKWREAAAFLETYTPNQGRMYEVRINADPEQLLDLDKPFAQQPDHVRSVLSDVLKRWEPDTDLNDKYMFQDVIRDPDTSRALVNAGIPGIRYLDQMSRNAGDGSRNYVLFDDSLVDIMRKYANAPTGAAAPLAISGQGQDNTDINALMRAYGLL